MEGDFLLDSKTLQLLKDEDFLDISTDDVELSEALNPSRLEQNASSSDLPSHGAVLECDDLEERFPHGGQMAADWDHAVFLSNTVLPEINPLLELNEHVGDDFQQMLGDWENHIDSLQNPEDVSSLVPTSVGCSHPSVASQHQSSSTSIAVSGTTASTTDTCPAPYDQSITHDFEGNAGVATPLPPIKLDGSSEDDGGSHLGLSTNQSQLTLGKKNLAGIVISSGPGGHFETYEGTKEKKKRLRPGVSLLKPLRKNINQHPTTSVTTSPSPTPFDTTSSATSFDPFSPDRLASTPPPQHDGGWQTQDSLLVDSQCVAVHDSRQQLVIEAPDVDNLLEQFEAEEERGNCQDPKRKAQIVAAVNNHFSSSTRNFSPGSVPKIVSSQRIKDALPREIIEKIKASSQKTKTIAIIEPVHKEGAKEVSDAKAPGGMTSRFQEAGASLNRNRLRQIGLPSTSSSSPIPSQISLDHDYCSSSNKAARRNNRAHHHQHQAARQAAAVETHDNSVPLRLPVRPSLPAGPATPNKTIIRVSGSASAFGRNPLKQQPRIVTIAKPRPLEQQCHQAPQSGHSISANQSSHHHQVLLPRHPLDPAEVQQQKEHSPRSPMPASPLTVSQRRDSDAKKDSGLESGEVSDASNNEEQDLGYSKLPGYLTTGKAVASRGVLDNGDGRLYDRLPSYVTGLARSDSDASLLPAMSDKTEEMEQDQESEKPSSCDSASSTQDIASPTRSMRGLRKRPKSRSSSSSSNSSSSSPSSSDSDSSTADHPSSPSKKRLSNEQDQQSPNIKSSVLTRSSSRRQASQVSSPPKESSRRQSKSTSSSNVEKSSSSIVRGRRRTRRSSGSSSSSGASTSRSRSRGDSSRRRRRSSRLRSTDTVHSRFTRDRQRREQELRHQQQDKQRQIEERRIVYVGRIAEGVTRADLRKRFEVFGPVEEISVHFRDRGDNYGFVTFRYKVDAYEAVSHGNDDPSYPKVDLCFGGRRTFCREKYSDLDSVNDENKFRNKSLDFDSLLKQARAGLRK